MTKYVPGIPNKPVFQGGCTCIFKVTTLAHGPKAYESAATGMRYRLAISPISRHGYSQFSKNGIEFPEVMGSGAIVKLRKYIYYVIVSPVLNNSI